MKIEMTGVREWSNGNFGEGVGYPVCLCEEKGRLVINAYNPGGYDDTMVDLLDLIEWLKQNKPELLK